MSGGGMNYAASAMSFSGTLEAARAQANTEKYNEKVAENNAQAIEQQGEAAVEAQARQFRRSLGAMHAAYGGSGVDASSGSALDVLADAVRSGTLDQLSTKYNYDVAKTSQLDQAELHRTAARNAKSSGFFNALANGLSGLSSGQVNAGGYGNQQGYATSNYWQGGNSLTPGSTYNGPESTSTAWPGSGESASDFSINNSDSTYTGPGSQATTWAGFGGGWG